MKVWSLENSEEQVKDGHGQVCVIARVTINYLHYWTLCTGTSGKRVTMAYFKNTTIFKHFVGGFFR